MSQNQTKGAISRQIDETLDRIDRLVEKTKTISDRVQQSTDESKQGGKR
jgi:uncharacterized protein (UPF0335 family)